MLSVKLGAGWRPMPRPPRATTARKPSRDGMGWEQDSDKMGRCDYYWLTDWHDWEELAKQESFSINNYSITYIRHIRPMYLTYFFWANIHTIVFGHFDATMKYYLCTYHISISKTPNGGLPNRIILILVGQKKKRMSQWLDWTWMEWNGLVGYVTPYSRVPMPKLCTMICRSLRNIFFCIKRKGKARGVGLLGIFRGRIVEK